MNLTFTKPQRLLLFLTYGWDVNQSTLLWVLEAYALFGAIAILSGGTAGAFLGALILTFVILWLQSIMFRSLQSRWQYVVFSAQRYLANGGRLWSLGRLLQSLRSFLEVALGGYCDELLAASSPDLERLRGNAKSEATLGRLLRGIALDARMRYSLGNSEDGPRFASIYVEKVLRNFGQSANPRAAARDFLVEYFHQVDEPVKRLAAQWEPPLNFVERLESHATLLQVLGGLLGGLVTLYFTIRLSGG